MRLSLSSISYTILENAKSAVSYTLSCVMETIYSTNNFFLTKNFLYTPGTVDEGLVRRQFNNLSPQQQGQVYNKVWELAKMEDPRIEGLNWGRDHTFDNIPRVTTALNRLGFLPASPDAAPIRCLPASFGEGGIGSQYFSLSEKAGRDPLPGQVGYINGMGIPTLEHAGRDASSLSNMFVDGNNIHCVYNATHQSTPMGDTRGFMWDILRMKSVDGGSYTKTSYLIAQQWIDFLDPYPTKKYLQIAHSEGAVHVNAALRMISQRRPDLLSKIRVVAFCPAHFILPETYGQGLQVINLYKNEDGTINPWATGMNKVGECAQIIPVTHTGEHPHNHLSPDYIRDGKSYINTFMRCGDIY